MKKKLEDIINDFASNSERWLQLKQVIEEEIKVGEDDIRAKRSLIKLVDQRIKEKERKIVKLN